ncbi:14-3-3 zeta [Stylonychia lemnae]|uniref:14-3-3 zeta n=1 Tax=Stylonychia lemnae TaxID=5949 RepID=A0A077ZRT6_STYLE|nr:14-3-3 zeta [Stylonychia lemnae]|eukprot:CDW72587.1 14-3-3 zeta [Stylonychia lemnae]
MSESLSREDIIYYAKLSEQGQRYDDMIRYIKMLANGQEALSNEVRNLVSVAYKNSVGSRRTALRVLSAITTKDEEKELMEVYRQKIQDEIDNIANEILGIIDEKLIPQVEDDQEALVLYSKMKGDYYRYMAEYAKGEKKIDLVEKSKIAYEQGTQQAEKLKPTNPVRLGLALSNSIFNHEIIQDESNATLIAKVAYDSALINLDSLEEDEYRDATIIMQYLRDQLSIWSTDIGNDKQLQNEGSDL